MSNNFSNNQPSDIKPNINSLANISTLEAINTFQKLMPPFSGYIDTPELAIWIKFINENLNLYLERFPESVKVSAIKSCLINSAKIIIGNRIFYHVKDLFISMELSFPKGLYKLEVD